VFFEKTTGAATEELVNAQTLWLSAWGLGPDSQIAKEWP
jgi:hypothetical protein